MDFNIWCCFVESSVFLLFTQTRFFFSCTPWLLYCRSYGLDSPILHPRSLGTRMEPPLYYIICDARITSGVVGWLQYLTQYNTRKSIVPTLLNMSLAACNWFKCHTCKTTCPITRHILSLADCRLQLTQWHTRKPTYPNKHTVGSLQLSHYHTREIIYPTQHTFGRLHLTQYHTRKTTYRTINIPLAACTRLHATPYTLLPTLLLLNMLLVLQMTRYHTR